MALRVCLFTCRRVCINAHDCMAEHTLIRASGERDEEHRRTERTGSTQHRKEAPDLQQIMQYQAKILLSGTFLCEKIRTSIFLSQEFFDPPSFCQIYTCRHVGTHCVCVFFPFILDFKFVGRTSRGHTGGRSHRIFHPPSFCGACLNFAREKDSTIPFPRRP